MQHDPLNDAMSMLKNAENVGRKICEIKPSSKLTGRVLKVLQDNGYIQQFEYVDDGRAGMFRVTLNGHINSCGGRRPRFSGKRIDLEKFEARDRPAQDFGVLILTTTEGVITHNQARDLGVGGRLLAYVY